MACNKECNTHQECQQTCQPQCDHRRHGNECVCIVVLFILLAIILSSLIIC